MAAIGFIFWIINLLLIGLFNLFFMALQKFISKVMTGLIIDNSIVELFQENQRIFDFTIAIGVGLLIIIVSYQLLKCMFAYMGFDAKESTPKILLRFGLLCFLIIASKDLAKIILNLYGVMAKGAFSLMNGKDLGDIMLLGFVSVLGGTQVFFSVEMFLFLFILFRMFSMLIKFAERFITCIMLIVFLPIGIAALSTKTTEEYGKGYISLLFGNLITQFVQIIFLVVVYTLAGINPLSPNDWINIFFVIGILLTIEKIDTMINNIKPLHPGFDNDSLGGIREHILFPSKEFQNYGAATIKKSLGKIVK